VKSARFSKNSQRGYGCEKVENNYSDKNKFSGIYKKIFLIVVM